MTTDAGKSEASSVPRFTGRERMILFLLLGSGFMLSVDFSILNVALPEVGAGVGLGLSGLPWVTSAYALPAAGFALLFGRMGDLFGRHAALHSGAGAARRSLTARRIRPERRGTSDRPRTAGLRHRDGDPRVTVPAHQHLRGRRAARPGPRPQRCAALRRLHGRRAGRRSPGQPAQLASRVLHQRPGGGGHPGVHPITDQGEQRPRPGEAGRARGGDRGRMVCWPSSTRSSRRTSTRPSSAWFCWPRSG